MKYVIEISRQKRLGIGSIRVAIYSEDFSHDDHPKTRYGTIVGAGFCTFVAGNVRVYGKSESLGIWADEVRDATVLRMFFGGTLESQRILIASMYEDERPLRVKPGVETDFTGLPLENPFDPNNYT